MGFREHEIDKIYGGRIRIRVCGILIQEDKILLVNHSGLNETNTFWSPPGGGIKFGESVLQCLEREFMEETGLKISPGKFLCLSEFIEAPLHAIEIFFMVKLKGGKLKSGTDPEMGDENQIIKNVEFLSYGQLTDLPINQKHNLLTDLHKMADLFDKRGYYRFR